MTLCWKDIRDGLRSTQYSKKMSSTNFTLDSTKDIFGTLNEGHIRKVHQEMGRRPEKDIRLCLI